MRRLPRAGAGAGAGAGGGSCAAVAALDAPTSVSSAAWSPDGAWTAACCSDNKIRFYARPAAPGAGARVPAARSVSHRTETGRWLTQLRLAWDPAAPATLLCGNMDRYIDAFGCTSGAGGDDVARARLAASARVTAVPTQVAAHPFADAVIGGTASGRVYVWRG